MKVWLVETGEYEQRGPVLIAVSREAAIAAIKSLYQPPYRVEWGEPSQDTYDREHDSCTMSGEFAAVPGYSTSHTAHFDISPWDVEGGRVRE